MRTVVGLELKQRLRGVAWWLLLSIWFAVIGLLTFAVWQTTQVTGGTFDSWLYSLLVLFVMMTAMLIVPAFSGGSINSDRIDGILATLQVTQVTASGIVWGKFFASLVTSLIYLIAAAPFLGFAAWQGNVDWTVVVVSLTMIFIELAVISAIGVGLSGVIAKPAFSIVTTYLVLAVLSIGTVISFGVATELSTTYVETKVIYISEAWDGTGTPECAPVVTQKIGYTRQDLFWWMLSANPFVVVADATPTQLDSSGNVTDLFGSLKFAVRSAQIPTPQSATVNYCQDYWNSGNGSSSSVVTDTLAKTMPSWFIGLGIHLMLGLYLMIWATHRTKAPMKRIPKGQRIA